MSRKIDVDLIQGKLSTISSLLMSMQTECDAYGHALSSNAAIGGILDILDEITTELNKDTANQTTLNV